MPFRYRQLLDVSAAGNTVHCLSFSRNGDYVVLGTDKRITVWDIDAGSTFEPYLKTIDPMSITWINQLSFVVGYSDGSLYSFTLILEEERLDVSGFVASQQPMLHLSSNASGTELASASPIQVNIWVKTQSQVGSRGALHWRLRNVLPSPSGEGKRSRPVSIAWFPEEQLGELLVVYEYQVIVWDTISLSAKKMFNISGPITNGSLSSMGAAFVVATEQGNIQIWDISRGILISSSTWKSKAFVRFTHGGHTLLIGRHARADIFESKSLLKIQTMRLLEKQSAQSKDKLGQPLVDILGDYCNDTNERYFIATASSSGSQAIIWKGDDLSSSTREEEHYWSFIPLPHMYFFFFVAIVIGFFLGTAVERKMIII